MGASWTEDLAVGVPEIDDQHRELFRLVDMLLAACLAGNGKTEAERVMGFLECYVVDHFSAEEALMHRVGYPQVETHHLQHRQMVQRLAELKVALARDGVTSLLVTQLNRSVVDWLLNHVGRSDRALADFLRARTPRNAEPLTRAR
ncbi:MAG: hemerythrin family protein [Myxococcota bacterium]